MTQKVSIAPKLPRSTCTSCTQVSTSSSVSGGLRRASSFLFPRRRYITHATTQADVLRASPNGEPLASCQQAGGHPSGVSMKSNSLICSLGTGTRSKAEFTALLQNHGIKMVIDVRRFPNSRIEHFKQQPLVRLLAEVQIDYLYLGEELGGYRSGGYQAFTTTPEFKQGIDAVERTAAQRRSAILCAERLPLRCHRRFITSELQKRGWQITHIIDERQTLVPGKPS